MLKLPAYLTGNKGESEKFMVLGVSLLQPGYRPTVALLNKHMKPLGAAIANLEVDTYDSRNSPSEHQRLVVVGREEE